MSEATTADAVAEAPLRIERSLTAEWKMIERARASRSPAGVGYEVEIVLDEMVARARAQQQGLPDSSVAAAAADPRVRSAIAGCIERINRTLDEQDAIVGWSLRA